MPAHRITVMYNTFLQEDGKWRLQAWVSSTENITEKVFVYQLKPGVPYVPTQRDVFVNVAQPSDIAEYPEDVFGDTFPFCRRNSIDLELSSSLLVAETKANIAQDLKELCQALDRVDP
jgi:hypothetical protein